MAEQLQIIHPHIEIRQDPGGPVAWIKGTRTAVRTVVYYHRLGWSADEIRAQFPHLHLAQIYDALSYYYDHQQNIEEELERESEAALLRASTDTPA